ncbi:hypothetical protein MLD38_035143 [Melastoma candidum]|uniref:Uncharacterized protein n=2 Tax=Melastoma candidum TaxID=119954 RepID=A0ACB9MC88_9MYRT|nr:hypothetical protein MLD38_035143 [Melastoma candidum]
MSLGRSFLSRKFSGRSSSQKEEPEECSNARDSAGGPSFVESETERYGETWGTMLPDLLGEIIRRVEESEDRWPQRQNVVASACVCKRWRDVSKEVVRNSSCGNGNITFPSCLKQPGPCDSVQQCLIKRDKRNSTFYLYLAFSPSIIDKGKFLLAARRFRHGAHSEYIISLDADDLSQGNNAYVGKLRSDFLGTNFSIYDCQAPHNGETPSNSRAIRRFSSKRISPQVPVGNFEVGQVSYKFNLLKSRGPRRMACSLSCPLNGETNIDKNAEEKPGGQTILRNKAPRWHEQLQCWCLNFHGRVTVASVKNFQLVATCDPSQPGGKGDEDSVLLQFGKVGNDLFTMDYRQPLSAFLAFAICLTSFGTKLACE